jgi:hypothetical protein
MLVVAEKTLAPDAPLQHSPHCRTRPRDWLLMFLMPAMRSPTAAADWATQPTLRGLGDVSPCHIQATRPTVPTARNLRSLTAARSSSATQPENCMTAPRLEARTVAARGSANANRLSRLSALSSGIPALAQLAARSVLLAGCRPLPPALDRRPRDA